MSEQTALKPLQLTLDGHVLISQFTDSDGASGILFQVTDDDHKTGDLCPQQRVHVPHRPATGELYLSFRSIESAVVVLETLAQVMCHLSGFPKRESEQA